MSCCRSAQRDNRSQGNSVRQPSLRAAGANQCSSARRSPASAPTRLTSTISPPGLSTRANSSSVASGFGHRGDDILRHHDIERVVRERQLLGIHDREPFDIVAGRARRPAPAPCAASARKYRRRRAGCSANSRAARCRCRRRPRGCGRRCARPPRSPPAGRARTPRRTPDHRPAPSAHRPSRPCPCRVPLLIVIVCSFR